MFNTEIKSNKGYKYWRIANIKTLTPNNPFPYQINKLLITTKDSDLADDPLKFSSESVSSGSFEDILDNNLSTNIQSAPDKSSVWWIQYEFENPRWVSEITFSTVSGDGREWQSFELLCSSDGENWYNFETVKTSIPSGNTEDFKYTLSKEYEDKIDNLNFYKYWRISNIEKRLNTDPYRSVGNIVFHSKEGLISNDPSKAISQSSLSEDNDASKAFDGLENTYSLSGNLPDGTNTMEHGESWWIGYNFEKLVELDSVDISMRYDMEGTVDNKTDNSLGQEWTNFQIDGSNDGVTWNTVYFCSYPKIFKNDTAVHSYALPEDNKIYAKFWKITNLKALNGDSEWRSFAELRFNTYDKQPFNDLSRLKISGNGSGNNDNSHESYLIDGNPNTRWTNMNKDAFVSYEFETPTYLESLDVQPRNDRSYNQELQSADIFYSYDGISWEIYGSIHPKIPLNDMSMVKNIPIKVFNNTEFQYQFKISETNKYKFWRCNNINTLPNYTNLSFDITGSILKFINKENLNLTNLNNSFSSSHAEKEVGSGVASNGFDSNPMTWFHNQYPENQNNNLKNYENYYIGCMFEKPVEVVKIGYQSRPNMDINWGQTWQSCNVQYSPNGFDWFTKGFCEFNMKRIQPEYIEKNIIPLDTLNLYKFWRISKVFTINSGESLGFDGWEIRFNTLTGEVSNNPSRGFSPNAWSDYWKYQNAFDGNVSTNAGGFHPIKDNDVPFYIGYEFQEPQAVNSISVLMRRDHERHLWIYATVEASDDGINWIHQGYSNLNTKSNTRFYTAKIESIPVTDKLNISEVSSISIESFSKQPLKLFSADNLETNSKFINIYNKNNDGMVTGTVTELGVPVQRLVSLYDRRTRKLVATTWSDKDGVYTFTSIDSTRDYYVHSTDSNNFYDAVTKDMIKPL